MSPFVFKFSLPDNMYYRQKEILSQWDNLDYIMILVNINTGIYSIRKFRE